MIKMIKNQNTYIFESNIVRPKDKRKVVDFTEYEAKEGDELIFLDTPAEAFKKITMENTDNIGELFGCRFPKNLVKEAKDGYDYFAIGVKQACGRKLYIYPDKTITKDYL